MSGIASQTPIDIVVASIWPAASAWARTLGWPIATKSTVSMSTPSLARTRVDRLWSRLPTRPTPKLRPARSGSAAMSALPAMRKGSDLLGETTAFSFIWSRATSWSTASTETLAISPSPACRAAMAEGVCWTRTSSTSTPSRSK